MSRPRQIPVFPRNFPILNSPIHPVSIQSPSSIHPFPSSCCFCLLVPSPFSTPNTLYPLAMSGTIIITGANGSLAIPTIQQLLTKYPDYYLVLTVRSVHTIPGLEALIPDYEARSVSFRALDLADLAGVHSFASTIAADICAGELPPLVGIVCNAYYWNLRSESELTTNSYERTFQVNHIAHAALVLRLLGLFDTAKGGRIVLFSSDAHWPGKNGLQKYPPAIPDEEGLDALVRLPSDTPPDPMGRGFQQYANSKLAIVMWAYALNRHLERVCLHLTRKVYTCS